MRWPDSNGRPAGYERRRATWLRYITVSLQRMTEPDSRGVGTPGVAVGMANSQFNKKGRQAMATFSQRMGIIPMEKAIQSESIDEALRNAIWNAIDISIIAQYYIRDLKSYNLTVEIRDLFVKSWIELLKNTFDTAPPVQHLKTAGAWGVWRRIVTDGDWNKVYDLVDFIVRASPDEIKANFQSELNDALKRENSAYRCIDYQLVRVTDPIEIEAIETAISKGSVEMREHFNQALRLLSDRNSPDYRNSIKESISAVESVCKAISKSPSATLNDALRLIKKSGEIHPAFEQSIIKLFAYTSDAGGIRHGLAEGATPPSYADAKFMLVSCSAFCSYLLTQAA